jgi:hypothetical protein
MKKKNLKTKNTKKSKNQIKSNEKKVYWKKLHFNPNCQLSIPNLQEVRVGVSTRYYDKEQHKE